MAGRPLRDCRINFSYSTDMDPQHSPCRSILSFFPWQRKNTTLEDERGGTGGGGGGGRGREFKKNLLSNYHWPQFILLVFQQYISYLHHNFTFHQQLNSDVCEIEAILSCLLDGIKVTTSSHSLISSGSSWKSWSHWLSKWADFQTTPIDAFWALTKNKWQSFKRTGSIK